MWWDRSLKFQVTTPSAPEAPPFRATAGLRTADFAGLAFGFAFSFAVLLAGALFFARFMASPSARTNVMPHV
jgi:hypothetical protein